jgi:hypothetical protein
MPCGVSFFRGIGRGSIGPPTHDFGISCCKRGGCAQLCRDLLRYQCLFVGKHSLYALAAVPTTCVTITDGRAWHQLAVACDMGMTLRSPSSTRARTASAHIPSAAFTSRA